MRPSIKKVKTLRIDYLRNYSSKNILRDRWEKVAISLTVTNNTEKTLVYAQKCQKGRLELVATYRKGKLVEVHESSAKSEVGGKVLAPP